MADIYRKILKKDVDLSEVSDRRLKTVLDEIGRDVVYNYLLFGKDYTYENFIENIKMYLQLNKYIDNE